MPHISVKMYSGRSDADKRKLAESLTAAMRDALGYGAQSVSVAIEDVDPAIWMDEVYGPDIEGAGDRLFKKPGYGPLAR